MFSGKSSIFTSSVVGYKVRKVSKKLYQLVNLTIFAQIVNEIQITWDEYS